jgi:DNA invertase Pin-like site-specific DNA recombinase
MDRVCIYLRKSRADLEAEARGEGETLAKHKKALLQVAKQQRLNIVKIRQEIVSGESLINRPEMMELLQEVERGLYNAVLVMDMDRLGRGNMREQGIILETFQKSGTKIITPRKVYDLQDEFDEEYSEFEAFIARKELKIITRRLRAVVSVLFKMATMLEQDHRTDIKLKTTSPDAILFQTRIRLQ